MMSHQWIIFHTWNLDARMTSTIRTKREWQTDPEKRMTSNSSKAERGL